MHPATALVPCAARAAVWSDATPSSDTNSDAANTDCSIAANVIPFVIRSPLLGYCRDVDGAPRLAGLATHRPMPVFTSGFALDEMEASACLVSDEAVTSGFASDQTEQGGSGRLVAGFKRYHRAPPRNAAPGSLTAPYMNTCLLLKRLGQQVDVLENRSRSERNGAVTV